MPNTPDNRTYPLLVILTGLIRFHELDADRPVFFDGYTLNESEWTIPVHVDLQSALPALPTLQREAIVVWLVDGRTEVEAASCLGVTRQGLRKRMRCALLHLQQVLCDGGR